MKTNTSLEFLTRNLMQGTLTAEQKFFLEMLICECDVGDDTDTIHEKIKDCTILTLMVFDQLENGIAAGELEFVENKEAEEDED